MAFFNIKGEDKPKTPEERVEDLEGRVKVLESVIEDVRKLANESKITGHACMRRIDEYLNIQCPYKGDVIVSRGAQND